MIAQLICFTLGLLLFGFGLVIYNPVNLASMIKGMKNTTITREQKIAIRKAYEQNKVN